MVLAACAIVQPSQGPELTTGMNHLADGQLAAAAEALSAYLETSPNDQVAQLVLGEVLVEQGDLRGAQARLAAAASDASLAPFAEQLLGPAELPQRAIDDGSVPCPCETCDECQGYDPWFDPERRWNFTVLTGYQYDSNVVLAPEFVGLGAATNRDDSSWFVASFGDYRLIQEPDLNVGLIMSTFDNFYFEQNDFDLQDYMLGAYANRAVNECWLAGIRFEFHETLLDYAHFANEFRLVPNLTYLQGDFGHFTSYYEFDAGQFDILPLVPALDRDARVNAVGFTQAIYTFAGLGRWFFGYRYEDAEADGDDFDRSTHMATARFERPICERWVMDGEVRQFWDDYDDPNSLDFFGNERSDQRTEVRWGLQWYLLRHASLRLDYTFINSNSNVANLFGVRFFEYDRHLVAPQFIYDF